MYTEEFMGYPSERAAAYLRARKCPWAAYGFARHCKARLELDVWVEDKDGVDVILFPLIHEHGVINIIAFEPNKPLQLYLRDQDTNLWALLDLITALQVKE